MTRPWEPECTVDETLAVSLLEHHVPALGPVRIRPLGVGWDNTAYVVNDAWVFRFPRRAIAADLLRAESALLPALAPTLPLPVPVPEVLVEGDDRFPWPFAGYRFLPGRTACVARADLSARRRAAAPLGRFLAALHAFPLDAARTCGGAPDAIDRLGFERRAPQATERLVRLAERGLVTDPAAWRARLEDTPRARLTEPVAVVHGDLYARHLLLDDAGAPAGVIDWGDVHLGDPAIDLALAHAFLPPDAHDVFRDAYGPIDERTWGVGRFKALHASLTILEYGDSIGDDDLVAEGLVALAHLAAG